MHLYDISRTINPYAGLPIYICISASHRFIDCRDFLSRKAWKNIYNTLKIKSTSTHGFYGTFILFLHHYLHSQSPITESILSQNFPIRIRISEYMSQKTDSKYFCNPNLLKSSCKMQKNPCATNGTRITKSIMIRIHTYKVIS